MSNVTILTNNKHPHPRRMLVEHTTESLGMIMLAQRRVADTFRVLEAVDQLDRNLVKKQLPGAPAEVGIEITGLLDMVRGLADKLLAERVRRIESLSLLEHQIAKSASSAIVEALPPDSAAPKAETKVEKKEPEPVPTQTYRGLRFDAAMVQLATKQVARSEKSTQTPPSDLPNGK